MAFSIRKEFTELYELFSLFFIAFDNIKNIKPLQKGAVIHHHDQSIMWHNFKVIKIRPNKSTVLTFHVGFSFLSLENIGVNFYYRYLRCIKHNTFPANIAIHALNICSTSDVNKFEANTSIAWRITQPI